MKRLSLRLTAVVLVTALLVSVFAATAAARTYGPYEYDAITDTSEGASDRLESVSFSPAKKRGYEILNGLANAFLQVFNGLYINPREIPAAKKLDMSGYLPGRTEYRTAPAENAGWRMGYASKTLVPPDFEPGKYYIGRSLTNMLAEGVYDDCRVRATALDDGTDGGIVIFAAVDGLGVTGGDTLAVRKAVLDWAAAQRSEEYYVRMMVAWYFATALAKQYEAALPYIELRRLDPWTHNKTIQKALESYRVPPEHKTYLKTLKRRNKEG